MNNEQGFSMIEAILSLFIWSICALFFLPLYHDMRAQLVDAKQQMHVAETMQKAALLLKHTGSTTGFFTIDGQTYTYQINDVEICVTYQHRLLEEKRRCENF